MKDRNNLQCDFYKCVPLVGYIQKYLPEKRNLLTVTVTVQYGGKLLCTAYCGPCRVQRVVVHVGYVIFVQALQELVRHHIESFNFMVDEGLSYAVQVSGCSVNAHTITTLNFVYCCSIVNKH